MNDLILTLQSDATCCWSPWQRNTASFVADAAIDLIKDKTLELVLRLTMNLTSRFSILNSREKREQRMRPQFVFVWKL